MSCDPLYKSDAPVGARDRSGVPEVVFYQVKHRFVDNERSIPQEAADIIYYTLAIGHHTGIIDASEERLRSSLPLFGRVCAMLPEGEARYKLEAVLRGGEVYIDKFKAPQMRALMDSPESAAADDAENDVRAALSLDAGPVRAEDERRWLEVFEKMLAVMEINPAASITGRRRGL